MSYMYLVIAGLLTSVGSTPAPGGPSVSPAPILMPTAAPAVAPTIVPSPVQVESCSVGYQGNLLVGTTGQLVINFTNYGGVTADTVRFHVQYGDQSLYIRDVGTFSPGVEITHKFKSFEGDLQLSPLLQGRKPVTCDVAWSHFTNGAIWPAPVPMPQQQ